MITLAHDLATTHHDLQYRLDLASSARGDRRHPRDHYTAIDTFLAIASRHNAAMVDAIAPLVRHLPGGHDLAHEYLAASRTDGPATFVSRSANCTGVNRFSTPTNDGNCGGDPWPLSP